MVYAFSKLGAFVSAAVISTATLTAVAPAYSAAITGQLDFTGAVTATATTFDFLPATLGTGNFIIVPFSPPNSGFFAPLAGTSGAIKDISSVPAPGFTTAPADVPILVQDFLTFASAPTASFTLTSIQSTIFAQTGSSVSATILVSGFFVDSSDPATTYSGSGIFTTQIQNQTIAGLTNLLASGGSVTASYSASFQAVPEPTPLPAILALGIIGTGVLVLRRRLATH